jgi:hypothetical protein
LRDSYEALVDELLTTAGAVNVPESGSARHGVTDRTDRTDRIHISFDETDDLYRELCDLHIAGVGEVLERVGQETTALCVL